MAIKALFQYDINRNLNPVVKVDDRDENTLASEINEYVITKELKGHFRDFFSYYARAIDENVDSIGVYISGFYGSGKSAFLKMLAYLLENQTVKGQSTFERLKPKFDGEADILQNIEKAIGCPTETILFDIDIYADMKKDANSMLRVFERMFYEHLGYYGKNLKVARLEKYLDDQDKLEVFKQVCESNTHVSWEKVRKAFAFQKDGVIKSLMTVLNMSEDAARSWYKEKEEEQLSVDQFVTDVKDYIHTKPDNFRLLFMVDEVGQFAGTHTDLLLQLQSIIEQLGTVCGSQAWVVFTGQEALSDIIKTREKALSKIMGRVKLRLSLSSTSVNEVIEKRILLKKPDAQTALEQNYDDKEAALANLFTFTANTMMDLKGFSNREQYANLYPFVPYQFLLFQQVLDAIAKMGSSGNDSGVSERSMLRSFYDVLGTVQNKDTTALVPFYRFYDAIVRSLTSVIRRVIDRAENAADEQNGLYPRDVAVLKLLYLIRYIDDIPANLDNITTLSIETLDADKIAMRAAIQDSLDRLVAAHYISKIGETYKFLTDEERDIAREIDNYEPDVSSVVSQMGDIIFGDIFTDKKFRYDDVSDFAIKEMVDGKIVSGPIEEMALIIMTAATDSIEKNRPTVLMRSKLESAVIVVLPEQRDYYDALEKYLKITHYVTGKNMNGLSDTARAIIHDEQDEARHLRESAIADLEDAIDHAAFFIYGDDYTPDGNTAAAKITDALGRLVESVYTKLNLIDKHYSDDKDIREISSGAAFNGMMAGLEPNSAAAKEVLDYLSMQHARRLTQSMADLQLRYQKAPYGWRNIDVAAVVALLIYRGKITLKVGGSLIDGSQTKLPRYLRNKSDMSAAIVSVKEAVSQAKLKQAQQFLRDYNDVMDAPDTEDALINQLMAVFDRKSSHFESCLKGYDYPDQYPGYRLYAQAKSHLDRIMAMSKDHIAFIDAVVSKQDDLLDDLEDLEPVEDFFKTQYKTFDEARAVVKNLRGDEKYFDEKTQQTINEIRKITRVSSDQKFDYRAVAKLPNLVANIKSASVRVKSEKQKELYRLIDACEADLNQTAADAKAQIGDNAKCLNAVQEAVTRAKWRFNGERDSIKKENRLGALDGVETRIYHYKSDAEIAIDNAVKKSQKPAINPDTPAPEAPKPKKYHEISRLYAFNAAKLIDEEEIDLYLAKVRQKLVDALKDYDGIKIN